MCVCLHCVNYVVWTVRPDQPTSISRRVSAAGQNIIRYSTQSTRAIVFRIYTCMTSDRSPFFDHNDVTRRRTHTHTHTCAIFAIGEHSHEACRHHQFAFLRVRPSEIVARWSTASWIILRRNKSKCACALQMRALDRTHARTCSCVRVRIQSTSNMLHYVYIKCINI